MLCRLCCSPRSMRTHADLALARPRAVASTSASGSKSAMVYSTLFIFGTIVSAPVQQEIVPGKPTRMLAYAVDDGGLEERHPLRERQRRLDSPGREVDEGERRRVVTSNCLDLPSEAPEVISVSSVGPSTTKADYSNYGPLKALCEQVVEEVFGEDAIPVELGGVTKFVRRSDVRYVEELVAPGTVTTLPLETLEAFQDHGRVRGLKRRDQDRAPVQLGRWPEEDGPLFRLAFSDEPSRSTLIGGVVICASTIWIARRESRGAR